MFDDIYINVIKSGGLKQSVKAKFPIFFLTLISVLALIMVPLVNTEETYAEKIGDVSYDIAQITNEGTFPYSNSSPDLNIKSGKSITLEIAIYSPTDNILFWASYSTNNDLISSVSTNTEGSVSIDAGEQQKLIMTIVTQQNVHGQAQLNLILNVKDRVSDVVSNETIVIGLNVLSSIGGEGYFNNVLGIYPLGASFNDPIYAALFTFSIWLIFGALIAYIGIPLLFRFFKRKDSINEDLTGGLGTSVLLVAIVAGMGQTLRVYGSPDNLISMADFMSMVLYIALGAIILWKIYLIAVDRMFNKTRSSKTGVDESLIPLFQMLGKITIAVFAVAGIFSALGGNLLSILAGAGIVGLAISLGAQNTLNQFFSGLSLLMARPFREGDIIKVGSEATVLKVNKVGFMNTVFYHNNNEQIISMPNDIVAKSTIYNYTSENMYFHLYTYFSVAYGSDIEKAKEIILKAAMDNPNVMKGGEVPMPGVRMTALESSSITIRLSIHVYDYNNSFSTDGVIRERVYNEFLKNGIEIPYPKLDVYVRTTPAEDNEVKVTPPLRKQKDRSNME